MGETAVQIYRNMVRLRFLDDKINEMIAGGIGITQHSTRGQEATPIAACAALEPQDYVMPYHRGWGELTDAPATTDVFINNPRFRCP